MSEHIVINGDRRIVVPESLHKIAVQFDHNAETVTFDCPRYWDEHDLSKMTVYINYMRPNETFGTHICDNVSVDSSDKNVMHFDWTISGHTTEFAGPLSFLVCIQDVDSNGNVATHWNSELNSQLYISSGMKCREAVLNRYPDIITQLLRRMNVVEDAADGVAADAASAAKSASEAQTSQYLASSHEGLARRFAEEAASSANVAYSAASNASEYAQNARDGSIIAGDHAHDAEEYAIHAGDHATDAKEYARMAESWAVGGTKLRPDESTNNAQYWCSKAQTAADGVAANVASAAKSASDAAESASDAFVSETRASASEYSATQRANEAVGAANAARTSETEARKSAEEAARDAITINQTVIRAEDIANEAYNNARMAESWAVGGTKLRPDESTNNAQYWCSKAQAIVGGNYMTVEEFENANIDCGNW